MTSAVSHPTPKSTIDKEKKQAFVEFTNGLKCPLIAFGTWKSEPGKVAQAVKDAIDVGYRHIDCAHVYGNEKEVGDALKEKLNEGVLKREDLFVTSKLWNTFHREDLVEPALRTTLKDLQLDYLDLYLIHWPMAYKEGDTLFPKDENDQILYSDAPLLETWKAMEKLVEKGLVKSIGVSNFNSKQIEDVLKIAKIPPAVNQVECHPYLNQEKLRRFLHDRNITMAAYSPLGSPDRPWATKDDPILLEDPKLAEIAKKYNVSVASICLRYQIQRGNIVIPKSVTKSRIQSNYDLFEFQIYEEEWEEIESLNKDLRYCSLHWAKDHKDYPFSIEF